MTSQSQNQGREPAYCSLCKSFHLGENNSNNCNEYITINKNELQTLREKAAKWDAQKHLAATKKEFWSFIEGIFLGFIIGAGIMWKVMR